MKFKNEANKQRDDQEARGYGDRWSEMQRCVMPKMEDLKNFEIEMMFEHFEADGTPYLDWDHGKVISVLNEKTRTVMIEWDDKCLHPDDRKSMKRTKDKLFVRK